MKIRHFLLCVVVGVSLLWVGCTPARSGTDYLTTGGRGEVTGRMNGMEFTAVIELGENGESVGVEYFSPASLCGVILVSDGERCEVNLGEISFSCEASKTDGFLRPATAFLLYGDVKSVQKDGENTVLTFPSGSVLTLSPKGEPLALSSEDIEVRVVWWECGNLSQAKVGG